MHIPSRRQRSLANVPFRLLALTTVLVSAVWGADNSPEPRQIMGKILSVERKGGMTRLKIDPHDGEAMEILWNKSSNFMVEMKGDDKFFRPGVYITTTARKSGMAFYADSFNVHLKSRLTPGAVKDAKGTDWDICGTLIGYDKNGLMLSMGALGPMRVLIDSNALDKIKVYIPSSDYVEEGLEVEVEGTQRGKKFTTSKLVVKLATPLTAEQAFSKKKVDHSKSGAAGKGLATKDAGTDAKTSEPKAKPLPRGKKPPAGQNLPNPDPFNVLGGNDNAKPNGKKPKK